MRGGRSVPSLRRGTSIDRRRPALAFFILALIAGAVLLFRVAPTQMVRSPQGAIEFQRWKNRTLHGLGFDLPGTPDLDNLPGRLAEHGLELGAPIFIRIFKREFELEVWLRRDGRFERFATYPVCRYSGGLGPKLHTGDKQAPEGVYTVDARALNPQSRWHRSFNLGFPNAYDRAHGRTGSFLMVHGGCSSVGCYAMTNAVIDEIWALVGAALKQGQPRFQVQVLPFRLTDTNMAAASAAAPVDFWRQLKAASDLFEADRVPPRPLVCRGRYVFEAAGKIRDGSSPVEVGCPQSKSGRS